MADQGYGNAEYWTNCSDLATDLGVMDRIKYREHIPQGELAGLMRESTFILSATNEEGCHTTVAEGMATGLVPLVGNWRGAEQIYGAEAIWKTPKQFVERVTDWMLLSVEEKKALSQAWHERAQGFDARAINAALADLIEGAVDAKAVYDAHVPHQVSQYANPRQRRCFGILMEQAETVADTRYLDVGCGVGYCVSQAALVGMQSFGVDISPALIEQAAYRAHNGAKYAVQDVTQSFPGGPWDIVSMFDSLEHIPTDKRQAVLAAAYNNLAESGKLLLTFPWGGTTEPTQLLEWPVHPKTVRKFTEEIGLATLFYGALDGQYFCMVCQRGAGAVALPETPEGMGAMAEGAWTPEFVSDGAEVPEMATDATTGLQTPPVALPVGDAAETGGETSCE